MCAHYLRTSQGVTGFAREPAPEPAPGLVRAEPLRWWWSARGFPGSADGHHPRAFFRCAKGRATRQSTREEHAGWERAGAACVCIKFTKHTTASVATVVVVVVAITDRAARVIVAAMIVAVAIAAQAARMHAARVHV